MDIRNRLVVPAMVTQYCERDGKANKRFIAYHEARAKGGWGLIITENYAVDEYAGGMLKLPGLWTDGQIESHSELTSRVHKYGAKICCQIYHAGRATHPKAYRKQAVAPSAIKDSTRRDLPRALAIEEIRAIVEQFGDAALRAKLAGFDMVEIHGGHGYLIHEFLSAFSNKRMDVYGGSLYNRCRFLREIIANTRAKVGDDFPLQLRVSAVEGVPGGLDIGETRAIARLAEDAGVDSLHISQGNHVAMSRMISPSAVPRGAHVENAAAIKEAVRIPVIGVGRINEPMVAAAILDAGKMDMVAMGRASLADPELPNKAREGSIEDISYCFGCVQGCIGRAGNGGIRCLANPELGLEYQDVHRPTAIRKKILIAGAGIAGCEAAILAADRGHEVQIWEKASSIGGAWEAAAMPPYKTEFLTLLFRQQRQLERYGITVHLNKEVTEEILTQEQPDVLMVATGGLPVKPPIQGIERDHVVLAADVLLGKIKVGKHVVVIGGGLVGAETADFMAQQGARVSIVEMLPELAKDGEPAANQFLMKDLETYKVELWTSTVCLEIGEDFVSIENNGTKQRILGVDQVVLAAGLCQNDSLVEAGKRLAIETIPIGDAAGIKNGLYNIWEAFDAAAAL